MRPRSLNEIELSARRGAAAMGWPYGLAEEVGKAAVWAAQHRSDAIHSLLDMVETARPAPERPVDQGMAVFERATVSSVVAGFDLLAAGAFGVVRFRLVHFLLGAAALGGGMATAYKIGFKLQSGNWTAEVEAGRCRLFGSYDPEAPLSLKIASRPSSSRWQPLTDGIELDPAAWSRLEGLAARSLVPATRISRETGAGAGLVDSD